MLLKPIEIMAINMGNSRLGQIVIIILIAYIIIVSSWSLTKAVNKLSTSSSFAKNKNWMKVFVMVNKHILIKLVYLPRFSTIGSKIIYSERLTLEIRYFRHLRYFFKLLKLHVAMTFSSWDILITRRRKKLQFAYAKC